MVLTAGRLKALVRLARRDADVTCSERRLCVEGEAATAVDVGVRPPFEDVHGDPADVEMRQGPNMNAIYRNSSFSIRVA